MGIHSIFKLLNAVAGPCFEYLKYYLVDNTSLAFQ